TVISSVVIVLLAIQETRHYLAGDIVEQLYVDSTTSDIRLDVHFDITFHRLPCVFISVDVMDVTNEDQDDIQHDIFKLRLDKNGKNITAESQKIKVNQNITAAVISKPECGSCYGALPEGSCCNTCEEVKQAFEARNWAINLEKVEQCVFDPWLNKLRYYAGEGCRVYGKIEVAKVAGNFHLAPGEARRIMNTHGAYTNI
ncbi:unnamed protein product, partial [Cylicostephanus goldi]